MPYLKFSRDKRGYENTYVVHLDRRRGKSSQRILYWFRTPPNVRVGRAALDEDAIRALEEQNPDLAFDWTRILQAQVAPAPADPFDHRRRGRDGAGRDRSARRRTGRPEQGRGERPAGRSLRPGPPRDQAPPASTPEATVPPVEALTQVTPAPSPPDEQVAQTGPVTREEPFADAGEKWGETDHGPATVPVTVYHGGADVLVTPDVEESPRVPPVVARLGSEQLGRVRARYAEVLARISEQAVAGDLAKVEELRQAAEVLNPDGWVTDAEIAFGLQQFDARLGEIRRALGVKRRRRSRRGGRRRRADGPVLVDPSGESGVVAEAQADSEPVTSEGSIGPDDDLVGGADDAKDDGDDPID